MKNHYFCPFENKKEKSSADKIQLKSIKVDFIAVSYCKKSSKGVFFYNQLKRFCFLQKP